MFNQTQYQLQNDLYIAAMNGLKYEARKALTYGDFDHLISLVYELSALAECDSEYDYTDETAQQWAQLTSQQE